MTERKKNIMKHIVSYSAGRYISQFIGFFIAICMRNFLGPLYMGMWSLMRVVMGYASYCEFGAMQSIYYKVPLHKGRGEDSETEQMQNTIFGFLILTSIIVSMLMLVGAVLLKNRMPHELFVGFMIFPLFFLAQRVYAFYIMLLRAHKEFVVLGKSYVFDSAVNLILIVLLVSRFKLYGLYVVSVLLPVLDICYMAFKVRYKIKASINWKKISSYIKFGFPVFMSGFSMLLLYSVDRIMIARMIGLTALGFYSIAVMTRTYTSEVSQNFASVLSPHFIEDYGKTGDISKTGRSIVKYTELTASIMAVILGIAYLALPILVVYIMPKYTAGIQAMKVMMLCTFFIVIAGHLRNFLVMKNRQIALMNITIFAIALNVIMNYIAIKFGYGIAGVAGASSVAALVMFFAIAVFALSYIEGASLAGFFVRVFALPLYSVLVMLTLEHFLGTAQSIRGAVLALVFFLIASSLTVYYVNRKTNVIGMLVDMVKEKFKNKKNSGEEITYG